MAKTAFLASSLLLLQSLTVVLSGSVIPRDDDDVEKGFSRVPEDPEIPPRTCDPDCKDAAYNLPENFYPYRNDIFTILFGRPGALESNPTTPASEILTRELTETLPYLIHQFGNVDDVKIPALVKEGVPLLVKDVLGLVGGQDDPNGGKITQWARKIAPKAICQFYAVAALPATEAASDTIYYANQNQAGKPTTSDQDYFLQPAYGPLAHRDDITIKYNAKFPALFGKAAAAFVQDRTTYVRDPDFSQYRQTPTAPGNPKFKDQIRTLLYQFKHTEQWSQTTPQDYLDNAYYLGYHYEYCLVRTPPLPFPLFTCSTSPFSLPCQHPYPHTQTQTTHLHFSPFIFTFYPLYFPLPPLPLSSSPFSTCLIPPHTHPKTPNF